MPEFLNTNPHLAYVDDPDTEQPNGLRRILHGEVVKADGQFADNLQETPGLVNLTDMKKADRKQLEDDVQAQRELLSGPGPAAYPAVDEDGQVRPAEPAPTGVIEPPGKAQGKSEPADTSAGLEKRKVNELQQMADTAGVKVKGTGKGGNVTKGDLVKALAPVFQTTGAGPGEAERTAQPTAVSEDDKLPDLQRMAKEQGVTVTGTGKNGAKTKKDYVEALNAGGGTVTTGDVPTKSG